MSLAGSSNHFVNDTIWEPTDVFSKDKAPSPSAKSSSSNVVLLEIALLDVEARNQFGYHGATSHAGTSPTGPDTTRRPLSTEVTINKVLRDLGCDQEQLDQTKAAGSTTNHTPFITKPMDPRNVGVNSNMRMNYSLPASSRHQDRSVEFPLVNASTTPIPSSLSGTTTKRSLDDFNNDSKQDFSALLESALKKPNAAEDYNIESSSPDDSRFRCYQTEQWSETFQTLLAFRKAHGHCLVPHGYKENMSLARWVKRQRYQHKLLKEGKPCTMTEERIQLLENVGFVWDSHHSTWEERVAELCQYKKRLGHCNVPSSYKADVRLATWVKCQRRQYKLFWQGKTCNITLDRMKQLQEMGFQWTLFRNKNTIP
jgi:hypothetical protein